MLKRSGIRQDRYYSSKFQVKKLRCKVQQKAACGHTRSQAGQRASLHPHKCTLPTQLPPPRSACADEKGSERGLRGQRRLPGVG